MILSYDKNEEEKDSEEVWRNETDEKWRQPQEE